jgi:hypothetical protein
MAPYYIQWQALAVGTYRQRSESVSGQFSEGSYASCPIKMPADEGTATLEVIGSTAHGRL